MAVRICAPVAVLFVSLVVCCSVVPSHCAVDSGSEAKGTQGHEWPGRDKLAPSAATGTAQPSGASPPGSKKPKRKSKKKKKPSLNPESKKKVTKSNTDLGTGPRTDSASPSKPVESAQATKKKGTDPSAATNKPTGTLDSTPKSAPRDSKSETKTTAIPKLKKGSSSDNGTAKREEETGWARAQPQIVAGLTAVSRDIIKLRASLKDEGQSVASTMPSWLFPVEVVSFKSFERCAPA